MKTLLAASLVSCAVQCHAGSLCEAHEDIIFSCNAKPMGISICASKMAGESSSYIHYLFGNARRIAVDFPPKDKFEEGIFRGYNAYGPGFQSYLTFSDGPLRYYVYSNYGDASYSTNRQKMAVAFEDSGIVVLKGLNKVAHIKCYATSTRLSEATFKRYRFPSDEADKFQERFFDTWSE